MSIRLNTIPAILPFDRKGPVFRERRLILDQHLGMPDRAINRSRSPRIGQTVSKEFRGQAVSGLARL
jgi:hypothetical protein